MRESGVIEPVVWLTRVAERLDELGEEDLRRLAGGLQTYLDPFAGCSLEEALGLAAAAGGEHSRTAAKRALRDEAIRRLAGYFPGLPRTRCAQEIAKLLARYAASRWRVDRARPTMPQIFGTPRAQLWAALVAGGGRVPRCSRIRQLLSIGTPLSIGSELAETCGHGTERTPDQRRHRQRC